jgi:molybdate transport system substrate-binding protein
MDSKRHEMPTIKVMSAGAVESIVHALGHEFESECGWSIAFTFNTAGALRDRFLAGETPDLLILPDAAIRTLEDEGHMAPGSRKPLATSVTGVAVRAGAPQPDISTVDAFRRALLAAKTVSYVDPKAGGSSGKAFASNLQRLGIAEEINRKAVLGNRGYEVAQAVADGRAEIGTTFISEMLTVPGLQVVGPLPGELRNVGTYTAGIPSQAAEPDAARALLAALTDPATRPRWSAAGLDPAF